MLIRAPLVYLPNRRGNVGALCTRAMAAAGVVVVHGDGSRARATPDQVLPNASPSPGSSTSSALPTPSATPAATPTPRAGKQNQSPTPPDKPLKDSRQLIEALEKHYEAELKRMSPAWTFAVDGPTHQPIDVAETVGVPGIVLAAILAGKCRDQRIPVTAERQKRFAEWIQRHCSSLWFTLHDSGVGPECAKGVVLALALNDRFTSLSLACNTLGDAGATVVARVLPEHQALLHLDLSANDIGHAGATAIFEALLLNRSVTYLDLSSRAGSLRNHFAKHNAVPLENLLATNPVLAKLAMPGTCLGPEATAGLARGLSVNTTLVSLDLAGDDLGPKGAAALAEALGPNCGLEELNLSENHLGDEGLAALAWKLGALPPSPESATAIAASAGIAMDEGRTTTSVPVLKQPAKYFEAMAALRRAVTDLSVSELGEMAIVDDTERHTALQVVAQKVAQLSVAMEMSSPPQLPRLRVLLLGGNDATHVGASRIEDALQVNSVIEKLTLDRADHMGAEYGAKSLATSLPLNTGLRCLNLSTCGLKTPGVLELAKALATNRTLEVLYLKGNRFGDEAAAALGAVLGLGGNLRQLFLSNCHLEDSSGVALAQGLVTNRSLETMSLRDNLLREGTGRALAEALRKHTALTNLDLELNSIDFRFLSQIKQLLERNTRLKEKARPERYRRRIEQLKECQREVHVLTSTINRNVKEKRKAKIRQAALLQEIQDTDAEQRRKQQMLDEQLEEVRKQRAIVDEEIKDVVARLQAVCSEGEHEANLLQTRIAVVEDGIRRHERHIETTKKRMEREKQQADEQLAALNEESDKVEKERSSAALLCAAAQRNLESFAASLKAIEEDIASGVDPRQRTKDDAVATGLPLTARSAAGAAANVVPRLRSATRTRADIGSTSGRASPGVVAVAAGAPSTPRRGAAGTATTLSLRRTQRGSATPRPPSARS